MKTRHTLVWSLLLWWLPAPAGAQTPLAAAPTIARPSLPADADSNSWLAYYNAGVARLRQSPAAADAAFAWASRIDPTRAEPLLARWVAFWRRNQKLFKRYLKGDARVVGSREIALAESLHVRALERNPFAPPVLVIVLYERLGDWSWSLDELSRGLRDYSAGNYADAATHFTWYVAERADNYWARYYVALSRVAEHQYDSAATEITTLLADAGRRTSEHISYLYQSQELLQYGLGALRLLSGDTAAARASLGEALTENLAFYPAHALLGDIALAHGESTQAVAEYAMALELRADDGVLHYRYARLLADVGRLEDAEVELRRAIELEPFYAPPVLGLALVLETRGNRAEAVLQYRRYLARTFRGDPRIAMAQERIRALSP